MKKFKIISVILSGIILTVLFLAGCNSNNNPAENNANTETTGSYETGSINNDFSYSEGLLDNGFWKDIKALDYVVLCEYSKISIPKNIHDITNEAIQGEIDAILYNYSTIAEITDRPVANGDTVNIDYVGSINDVEFNGGSTDGYGTDVTIGVTQYIDDFLEQLIGHSPGESFDIEVTFPVDYGNEDLNGKDAKFAITINYIVETVIPELTDSFVTENLSIYGWKTIEEMKTDIKNDMQNSAISSYVQNYIFENTTVKSVPENIIRYQEKSMLQYFRNYAEYYEMEINEFLNTYMELSGIDELIALYSEDMKEIAMQDLITQAIAEDAGISVNNDDVAAYFQYYEGVEDYSEYEATYGMPYLKYIVLNQKVIDYLEDNAVKE